MPRYVNANIAQVYLNEQACEQIKCMPTEDVAPVNHGHWTGFVKSAFHGCDDLGDPIYHDVTVWHCSVCNRKTVIKEKFCPNCGAKMDGKDGERE